MPGKRSKLQLESSADLDEPGELRCVRLGWLGEML